MSSYVPNNGIQKQIMLVIVCPQKQKTYNIEVEADTTIGELGNELFSALDCQNDEQCVLYYNGQALQNDSTFQDYGIGKGKQIEIKIEKIQQQQQNNQQNNNDQSNFMQPSLNEITLTVLVTTNQKKYQINVMKNHQVRELTTKMSNILQIQSNSRITFSFEGITLVEERTFEHYGIPNLATLHGKIQTVGGIRF